MTKGLLISLILHLFLVGAVLLLQHLGKDDKSLIDSVNITLNETVGGESGEQSDKRQQKAPPVKNLQGFSVAKKTGQNKIQALGNYFVPKGSILKIYPKKSILLNEQGVVELMVDPKSKDKIKFLRSSGYSRLDQAAFEYVKQRLIANKPTKAQNVVFHFKIED